MNEAHTFGGPWTRHKLDVIEKYLKAYQKVLKNQAHLKTAYIDAFAGTGYCRVSTGQRLEDEETPLLEGVEALETEQLLEGSARRAIQVTPPFDRMLFIDRSAEHCAELEKLCDEFPDRRDTLVVRQEEANAAIQDICNSWPTKWRGVLFLDPYGMQVDWPTIEAVAKTKSIDLWLLFPVGIGVNRLLKRDGRLPEGWKRRLTRLFGDDRWYDEFYKPSGQTNMFTGEESREKQGIEVIQSYLNRRLGEIFAGVAPKPALLKNSTNSPMYSLCFAVGNPAAVGPALGIANHLLKGIE